MRFRFRTLLIVMALMGLVFAVVTHYHRRRSAIAAIRDHGGVLTFKEEVTPGAKQGWSEAFCSVERIETHVNLDDRSLRFALLHLTEVQELTIRNLDFSTETAARVGKLPHLESLSIQIVGMSSESLEAICRSTSLQSIDILEPLNTEHCEAIGKCKSLRKVDISHTDASDARLDCLNDLPRLESLVVYVWDERTPRDAIERLLLRHPEFTLTCVGVRTKSGRWLVELRERFPKCKIQTRY